MGLWVEEDSVLVWLDKRVGYIFRNDEQTYARTTMLNTWVGNLSLRNFKFLETT